MSVEFGLDGRMDNEVRFGLFEAVMGAQVTAAEALVVQVSDDELAAILGVSILPLADMTFPGGNR